MPILYKIDVLAALKAKGYSTYTLRQQKLMGEATLTKIRSGELVSWENIARICELLECDIGDILTFQKSTTVGGMHSGDENG